MVTDPNNSETGQNNPRRWETVERWVVSIESLDVPARAAVLKSLHSAVGLNVIVDNDRVTDRIAMPFVLLLRRLKALSRVPHTHHALFAGSWMLHAPTDPLVADLYAELGAVLVDALGILHSRHLMICMRVSVDEAYETALGSGAYTHHPGTHGPATPDMHSLQGLARAQDEILSAHKAAVCSPLRAYAITVDCPAFAADTPVELDALSSRVERAVAAVVWGCNGE